MKPWQDELDLYHHQRLGETLRLESEWNSSSSSFAFFSPQDGQAAQHSGTVVTEKQQLLEHRLQDIRKKVQVCQRETSPIRLVHANKKNELAWTRMSNVEGILVNCSRC